MTSLARGLAMLLCAGVCGGCTVTAQSQQLEQGPSNACSVDSDCDGENSAETSCKQGLCQTRNGHLESLLVEVTPTSDSVLPHIPFIRDWEGIPPSGGDLSIELAPAVRLTGRLRARETPGCQRTFLGPKDNVLSPSTDGKSMPIAVTLTPQKSVLGLPSQIYLADATRPTVNRTTSAIEYIYDLQVPAGTYDVYVEPVRQDIAPVGDAVIDESCRVPPQLFRGIALASPVVEITSVESVTSQVTASILFPEKAGVLDGWRIDIIEPLTGHPISTSRELGSPELVTNNQLIGKQLLYKVPLSLGVVDEADQPEVAIESATELVRLRPPEGLVAPTLFFDRAGLSLFNRNEIAIDGFTQFPAAVTIEGQITALDGGKPSEGTVTLVSTEIFGVDQGIFASFQASLTADETGLFSAQVPPGNYVVYAVPPLSADPASPGLSALQTSWDIPADIPFQAGRLIELPSLVAVKGQTAMVSAEIRAVASPQTVLPFDQAFGGAVFVPRAMPGLIDDKGRFVVSADPGFFDVALRPPEASGFAWAVKPRFLVEADEPDQPAARLSLTQAHPSLVTGVAKVGETRVTSALIRAYAYLDKDHAYTRDPREALSVVQVAETRTDEEGAFRLLVPDAIK